MIVFREIVSQSEVLSSRIDNIVDISIQYYLGNKYFIKYIRFYVCLTSILRNQL